MPASAPAPIAAGEAQPAPPSHVDDSSVAAEPAETDDSQAGGPWPEVPRTVGTLGSSALTKGGAFASLTEDGDISADDVILAEGDTSSDGLRGRTTPVPSMTLGRPTVSGGFDVKIINRYIRRSSMKLQYCYERQLLADQTLSGTVTAKLQIMQDGSVAESSATGVDPEVSSCVAAVIKSIEFPKTNRKGVVLVTYPIKFHHGGS